MKAKIFPQTKLLYRNYWSKLNAHLDGMNSTVSFIKNFVTRPKSNDDVFMFISVDVAHVVVSDHTPVAST